MDVNSIKSFDYSPISFFLLDKADYAYQSTFIDLSAAVNLETLALSSNRYMSAISICNNKHLKRFFGQLMQVIVASAGQMEQFRKQNPDSKFTLCP